MGVNTLASFFGSSHFSNVQQSLAGLLSAEEIKKKKRRRGGGGGSPRLPQKFSNLVA